MFRSSAKAGTRRLAIKRRALSTHGVCYRCKGAGGDYGVLCATCRKLQELEDERIELARSTGKRIDVDFSAAPIANRRRLAAVSNIVQRLNVRAHSCTTTIGELPQCR